MPNRSNPAQILIIPQPLSIPNPNDFHISKEKTHQTHLIQIQKYYQFPTTLSSDIISPTMKSFLGFILGIALICEAAAAKNGNEVFYLLLLCLS